MRSSTETIAFALRILAATINSPDDVPRAALQEAADRLDEHSAEVERLRGVIRRTTAAFERGGDMRETYDRLRAAITGKEAQS